MNDCSISWRTFSLIALSTGSSSRISCEPPRSSSQFDDHSMVSIGSPDSCDTGRAVGTCFESFGADRSLSYSYVHGS